MRQTVLVVVAVLPALCATLFAHGSADHPSVTVDAQVYTPSSILAQYGQRGGSGNRVPAAQDSRRHLLCRDPHAHARLTLGGPNPFIDKAGCLTEARIQEAMYHAVAAEQKR